MTSINACESGPINSDPHVYCFSSEIASWWWDSSQWHCPHGAESEESYVNPMLKDITRSTKKKKYKNKKKNETEERERKELIQSIRV